MKYIVILGDGMADKRLAQLGNKTPLMVAKKPNIDYCAQNGYCGMAQTVPNGMKPGSDVANLSVLGYAPEKYYSGRSPLEALSIGINMADSDVATRCNLVTLSDEQEFNEKTMVDYSAGEIDTIDAHILIDAVQKALGNEKYAFFGGVSYRHCLITHNSICGTNYTPPHDISGKKIGSYLPAGHLCEQMLELTKKSYEILKNHPLNIQRVKDGKNPANSIWLWGEGTKPLLPPFKELYDLNGAVISAVDLLKGIAIASGMRSIDVEGATGNIHTNFEGKAKACVEALNSGCDYVYLHIEAPDECGHQGDIKGKVQAIECIDEKVVGYLMRALEGQEYTFLICPDHPTPLDIKTHTSDAVPFIIYSNVKKIKGIQSYTEEYCNSTGVYLRAGTDLIKTLLDGGKK